LERKEGRGWANISVSMGKVFNRGEEKPNQGKKKEEQRKKGGGLNILGGCKWEHVLWRKGTFHLDQILIRQEAEKTMYHGPKGNPKRKILGRSGGVETKAPSHGGKAKKAVAREMFQWKAETFGEGKGKGDAVQNNTKGKRKGGEKMISMRQPRAEIK